MDAPLPLASSGVPGVIDSCAYGKHYLIHFTGYCMKLVRGDVLRRG